VLEHPSESGEELGRLVRRIRVFGNDPVNDVVFEQIETSYALRICHLRCPLDGPVLNCRGAFRQQGRQPSVLRA
jgi:hypothetical protein